MRNLDILSHFRAALELSDPNDTVIKVCLDEFSKALFVYTSSHKLIGFKYGSQEGESQTINQLMYRHDMAGEHPAIE